MEVIALLNDTVGTMMASSWGGKPCEIALVMGEQRVPRGAARRCWGGLRRRLAPPQTSLPPPPGTGTNSCFMAEAQLVEVVEENNGRMCVNSEWGCFGDDGALNDVLTPYDHRVDQESSNPGERRCSEGVGGPRGSPRSDGDASRSEWTPPWCSERAGGGGAVLGRGLTPTTRRFEKMVGGLYLGEIVRHAMLMLAAEQALFVGASTSALGSKDAFKTQQVLEIME